MQRLAHELAAGTSRASRALGQRGQRVERRRARAPSAASALEVRLQRVEQLLVAAASRARARARCADSALSSNAFSSGVMKRSAFFSVWRRW